MRYRRMPIEIESPEERGYGTIRCNLTESSYRDQTLAEIGVDAESLATVPLAYTDHRGDPHLRALVAEAGGHHPDDVLVTPGAAAALFVIATALLDRGDRVVVARTNYATNIETPRMIGAEVVPIDLRFEDGYRLDVDRLDELVAAAPTTLVSITYPHNPTGAMIDRATLEAVVALVERHGATLLVDETYRDLTIGPPLPTAASLSPRAISVSSVSKSFGLPGIRTGWLATSDPDLRERFLAAKEQIVICGSVLDEWVAARAMARRDEMLAVIGPVVEAHRALVAAWIEGEPLVEWVEPAGGVVCFPRLVDGVDPEAFYRHLDEVGGTFVGEGHWFEADRRSFRLGYGWPTTDELTEGLAAISAAAAAAQVAGR